MHSYKKYLTIQNIAIAIIAVILLQTLPFKFLWLPESVALFKKLWQEPRGRIGTWILELCGVIWLFIPKLRVRAAIWISILMCGAIYFHATILWLDGLAISAGVVLLCALYIVYNNYWMISKK